MSSLPVEARLDPAHFPDVHPKVVKEFARLEEAGVNISLVDARSPEALDPARQLAMNETIDQLEEVAKTDTDAAFAAFTDVEVRPGMNAWAPQRKRAIALHPLYNARSLSTLGEGISLDAFDRPIFAGGSSARQRITAEKGSEKADKFVAATHNFLQAEIDHATREMFQGCYDGLAVNTRAIVAFDTAVDHIDAQGTRDDIKIASLACGAAGRVYDFIGNLEQRGHTVQEVHMLDKDVLALSCAHALTDANPELQGKLNIHEVNLLHPNFIDSIEPESLDVADALGIFEYLPRNAEETALFLGCSVEDLPSIEDLAGLFGCNPEDLPQDYNFAAAFLKRTATLLKPGGQIVFGNMLNERKQQVYFNEVVQWPNLYQRSMSDVLEIIQAAGFDLDQVEVKIPANEGVYAVYVLTLPEAGQQTRRPVESHIGELTLVKAAA